MPTATTTPARRNLPILGGEYPAVVYPDGSADLLGVPVFGELEAYARRNPFPIRADWHRDAWKANKEGEAEQYLPPTHVGHHDEGAAKPTQRAGYFRIVDVRPHVYRGKLQSTMFADLLRLPPDVFKLIEAGKLGYASPEVCHWREPEIASIALLDDEAPNFKFPLITVGKQSQAEREKFAAQKRHRAVFKFRDFTPPRAKAMPDDLNPSGTPANPAPSATPSTPDPNAALPPWAPALVGLIVEGFKQAMQGGDQQAAMADAQKPPMVSPDDLNQDDTDKYADESDDEKKKAEAAKAKGAGGKSDNFSGQRNHKLNAAADKRFAAMEAELAAMRSANSQRETKEKLNARTSRAFDALKGYQLDDKTKQAVHKFAAQGDDVLNEFVDTFKRNVTQDPPESFSAYAGGARAMGGTPKELEKFAAKGPEALATAKRLLPQFQNLQNKGSMSVTFDEFVAANAPEVLYQPL